MTKDEIAFLASQDALEGIEESNVIQYAGCISINGLLPLPVTTIQCSISNEIDPIVTDENEIYMGTLCLCTKRASSSFSELTRWQQAAYLVDVENYLEFPQKHTFNCDYLVLDKDTYERYRADYWEGAPIWGCFVHAEDVGPDDNTYTRSIDTLTARPSLRLPTGHHLRILRRAVSSSDCYDRFLRLYHQLELLFDWVVVRQIQDLGQDLIGIGQIMSHYGSGDLDRLKYLLRNFCTDTDRLAAIINEVSEYNSIAKQIFFEYGKQGNPVSEEKTDRFWALVLRQALTFENSKTDRIESEPRRYSQFIRDVSAYWIYRVRSSIAHSRIGEYMLKDEDEEFVIEFAEKLLREVLIQLFSNERIKTFIT